MAGTSRVSVKGSPASAGDSFTEIRTMLFCHPIVCGSVPTLNLIYDENGFDESGF